MSEECKQAFKDWYSQYDQYSPPSKPPSLAKKDGHYLLAQTEISWTAWYVAWVTCADHIGYLEKDNGLGISDKERLAKWMIRKGFTTGHGDTIEDLLKELDWQIEERHEAAEISVDAWKALRTK